MGVRPPAGGSNDREAIEFGIAALTPIVEEADLDPDVPVDAKGQTIPLSVVLEETERSPFESERDLLNELHPIFEACRENVATGWLSSIRRQLPF